MDAVQPPSGSPSRLLVAASVASVAIALLLPTGLDLSFASTLFFIGYLVVVRRSRPAASTGFFVASMILGVRAFAHSGWVHDLFVR
jgi:hypothetical protein